MVTARVDFLNYCLKTDAGDFRGAAEELERIIADAKPEEDSWWTKPENVAFAASEAYQEYNAVMRDWREGKIGKKATAVIHPGWQSGRSVEVKYDYFDRNSSKPK